MVIVNSIPEFFILSGEIVEFCVYVGFCLWLCLVGSGEDDVLDLILGWVVLEQDVQG